MFLVYLFREKEGERERVREEKGGGREGREGRGREERGEGRLTIIDTTS